MRKQISFIFFLCLSSLVFAQQKKSSPLYGIGVLHNFQTKGTAIDLRASIPVFKTLFVSPRFSYFPAFNDIHEYYIGTDLDYHLPLKSKIVPYVYVGGFYNNWINSSDFHNKKSKKNNVVFEGGAGILFSFNCIHPFLEYRYDTKWKEGSLGAGIMLQFGECFDTKSGRAKKCPRF